MNLNEDEIIQKYAKQCKHCSRNNLLPYGYEFTCISSGYNVIKRKNENSKLSREKIFLTDWNTLNTRCFAFL